MPVDRGVRWRLIAPVLALLLTATTVFGAMIALLGGISLLVHTPASSSATQPSDQAMAQTLKALLEAPTQVLGLCFGGHLHGIAATGLGVLGLDARVRSVCVLLVFGLLCRALSRQGLGRDGLPWRDALVAAAISGASATAVLSLAALALSIDASTRDGGELFTAFSPMLVVGSFTITAAVVFWALLPPAGHPALPPPLRAARAAVATVWRMVWTFALVVLVAALVAAVVLASRHGVRPVLGVLLVSPLALGNGVLAALDLGVGGRITWQAALPYQSGGTLDVSSVPVPVALGAVVAVLASALLTTRQWRRLRDRADASTPWWLLPLAFLAAGVLGLWLLDASGAFSDGGSLGGQVGAAWWTPVGCAAAGVLVDLPARLASRRRATPRSGPARDEDRPASQGVQPPGPH